MTKQEAVMDILLAGVGGALGQRASIELGKKIVQSTQNETLKKYAPIVADTLVTSSILLIAFPGLLGAVFAGFGLGGAIQLAFDVYATLKKEVKS